MELVSKKFLVRLLTVTIVLTTLIEMPKIFAIVPIVSAQTTTVSISRIYNMTEPGTTFLVYINVSDVTDLNKWRINLTWDPAIIKIGEGDPNGIVPLCNTTKYNVYEGGFLKTASANTYFGIYSVNNDNGWVQNLWGSLVATSANGSGVLAIINFTLLQPGTTKIEITGTSSAFPGKSRLQDKNGVEIPHEDIDGLVSDKPPPLHETTIAIINLETGDNKFIFSRKTPINSTFIANVTVTNCSFLALWGINITWDPTLLEIVNKDLNADMYIPSDNVFGAWAESGGHSIGLGMAFFAVNIMYGGSRYVNVTYGTLCQIRFTIIRNDTELPLSCNIHIVVEGENCVYTKLVDFDAYEISYTPQDGTYEMFFPSHDVGIASVATSKTVVEQGSNLCINITIFNYGSNAESFNVTAYVNTTIIFTLTSITIASENSTTLTFMWNTSSFARAYVISANVTILPDETDTADNTHVYGIVKVSCIGDVNGDYVTDGQDYQLVKIAVPSSPGSPNWNPNADFNDNLTVDNEDFQIVKNHIPSHL